VPKDPTADPEIQGFYEKLRNHQGAVDAMMKMAQLMKDKGGSLTLGAGARIWARCFSGEKGRRQAGKVLMRRDRHVEAAEQDADAEIEL
jgi:hypothetical protein